MSEHRATIRWAHTSGAFLKGQYSREHTWSFDGGMTIPASPSPSAVPKPYCNEASVDPEEAFVASIASCHMLTYLFYAYREGIEVTRYEDDAVGVMTKNEHGVPWVSSVVLKPRIAYAGGRPAPDVEARLHHLAHEQCFIANSVKTDITVAAATDE
jgi:organic hydroperoxide reductase OsmC/OhrA